MLTIYADVFSCQVSFHATPDSKKKEWNLLSGEVGCTLSDSDHNGGEASAEKPVHLSLSLFHIHKVLGECLSIPKPAGRYNPSIMSPVCLWAPCQMGMPQTPPRGSVRKASLPDAIQPQHFQQNFKKKKKWYAPESSDPDALHPILCIMFPLEDAQCLTSKCQHSRAVVLKRWKLYIYVPLRKTGICQNLGFSLFVYV